MSQYPPPPGSPTPPPAYGAPPPSNGWDLGTTVSWAWAKFQQNLTMVVGALVLLVGIVVIEIIGNLVLVGGLTSQRRYVCDTTSTSFDCHFTGGTPFLVTEALSLLVAAVILVYVQIVGAGLVRGALGVTQGRAFEISDVFNFARIGPVVVTALLTGAAVFVGTLLCIVPGIIAGFLLSYGLYFVIDKDMAPMDALRASYELTTKNLGSTIVWYLVGGLIAVAGAIACGIGIIATIPIALLGTAYTYKKLTGQEVVA